MSNKTILVTGKDGLCGSAIFRQYQNHNLYNFVFIGRENGDLRNKQDVEDIFKQYLPSIVIHTSAKVGGIGGNEAMHEEFFYDNILMNAHIIRACLQYNVKKLFAFSSVCVFPDNLAILEEEKIHDGPVFASNFAYGYAKRMVDIHIQAAKKQYGVRNYTSIIPGNIFGPNDMFSIEHGHIVPALIHKLYLAIKNDTPLHVWGDGKSLREFIYVDDLASAILRLLYCDDLPDKIIISGRQEISIQEIVNMLVEISGFDGVVMYETDKPNGQRSRPSSKTIIDKLLPDYQYTDIYDGLYETWHWFCDNYPNIRCEYK